MTHDERHDARHSRRHAAQPADQPTDQSADDRPTDRPADEAPAPRAPWPCYLTAGVGLVAALAGLALASTGLAASGIALMVLCGFGTVLLSGAKSQRSDKL